LISIASPTGLEGVVELLMFKIDGTGALLPPPQEESKATTTSTMIEQTADVNISRTMHCNLVLKSNAESTKLRSAIDPSPLRTIVGCKLHNLFWDSVHFKEKGLIA